MEDVTISKSQLQYILDYTKEAGITFPVLLDQGLKVFNLYGLIALPTTFLINDTGIIVGKLAGYPISSRNQLMKTIRETIQPGSAKELSGPPQVAIPNGKAHRYYQMAKVLNERGNYPGAIESLRKSIALDQNFLPAHNLLATTLFKTGQQEEARDIFNNIIASNPHNLLFQLDYGNFLIQSGSADQGLAVLRQVLAEDNNYAIGHYYLGNYLFQQGAIDEALREAQSAGGTRTLWMGAPETRARLAALVHPHCNRASAGPALPKEAGRRDSVGAPSIHAPLAGLLVGAVVARIMGGGLELCIAVPFLEHVFNVGGMLGLVVGAYVGGRRNPVIRPVVYGPR